jgi:hypothetical protein
VFLQEYGSPQDADHQAANAPMSFFSQAVLDVNQSTLTVIGGDQHVHVSGPGKLFGNPVAAHHFVDFYAI